MKSGSARVQRWSTARDWTLKLIRLRYLIVSIEDDKGRVFTKIRIRWRCTSSGRSMDMLWVEYKEACTNPAQARWEMLPDV